MKREGGDTLSVIPETRALVDGDGHDHGHHHHQGEHRQALSRKRICKCRQDLEDMHPLRQQAALTHIEPCLGRSCCRLCFTGKPDFRFAVKESILKELGLKLPRNEYGIVRDPYLMLGYGANAFFEVLGTITTMFILIFLFSLPVFYIYSQGSRYDAYDLRPLIQFFMGNVGGSTVFCKPARMGFGEIDAACPPRTYFDAEKAVFGVMSNQHKAFTHCHEDSLAQLLWDHPEIVDCTKYIMDRKAMTKRIIESCHGEEKCTIIYDKLTFHPGLKGADVRKHCDQDAYFFFQAPCLVPKHQMRARKLAGLYISCFAVFVYFFSIIMIQYIEQVQRNRFIQWDFNTITAADYTVEFKISQSMYDHFVRDYYDETNPISEIGQCRLYIKEEMERRLSAFPSHCDLDEDIEIAIVTFAFDNAEIIRGLRQRGKAIRQEDWDLLEKTNDRLTKRLECQDCLDKMQRPVAVFLTMQTEEGKCRAEEYNTIVRLERYQEWKTFLGSAIDVHEAGEPTDIIWENRHHSDFSVRVRALIFLLVMAGILCTSFMIIYQAQRKSLDMKRKYPHQDCREFVQEYDGRDDAWRRDAIREYQVNSAIEEDDGLALYTGPLQCFCQEEKKRKHSISMEYELSRKGDVVFSEPICYNVREDKYWSSVLSVSISFIVVGMNIILRYAVMYLVQWVGDDSVSTQKGRMVQALFVAQFFNTGFIILIANANLSEHEPKALTQLVDGPHYDYGPHWFIDVGLKVCLTMLIQCVMPYVNLLLAVALALVKRGIDTGFTYDPFRTKKASMLNYKGVYAGGEFQIHTKYTTVMNITFTAMMYGLSMPVLFPLAGLSIYSMRVCNRIQVAWLDRLPPAMNDSITRQVLNVLKFSPLFLIFNGYWLMDNKQTFDNVWRYKKEAMDHMPSGHQIMYKSGQSAPLFYSCMVAIGLLILQFTIPIELLQKAGFSMAQDDVHVDEDLPDFFDVVKLVDANQLIQENITMQQRYGFEIYESTLIENLQKCLDRYPRIEIQGCPWYNMLNCPNYASAFAYIAPHVKDRDFYIEDCDDDDENNGEQSDLVLILLNLGAIPDFVARKFSLRHNFAGQFLGQMHDYKTKFEEEQGVKWEYSHGDTIRRFTLHKRRKDEDISRQRAGTTYVKAGSSRSKQLSADDTTDPKAPGSRGARERAKTYKEPRLKQVR